MSDTPFTIILVDDEALVREGIRDRIPWGRLGFELIGDFEDGRAALTAARETRPDAILTDIRMPFIDGIELARIVADELPGTKVLLLTGHDEFEYAQAAVRLQVWDFLLKPISSRGLSQVLTRLAQDLESERRRTLEEARLRALWREHEPLIRERALNELMLGNSDVAAALNRLANVGVVIPSGRIRVVLVSPDPPAPEFVASSEAVPAPEVDAHRPDAPDVVALRLGELVRRGFTEPLGAIQFSTAENAVAIIISGPDGDLNERLEALRRGAEDEIGTTVTIGVGRAHGRVADARSSFYEARRALMQRFLSGGNRIITFGDGRSGAGEESDHAHARAELVAAIRRVDPEGARGAVGSIIDLCRRSGQSVERCVLDLQRDLAGILEAAEELGFDERDILADAENPFQALAAAYSLEQVSRRLSDIVERILAHLSERMSNQTERKVRAAQTYVLEHFADPDLSLTHLCAQLSVSVSHFSTSFKEAVGSTFVEYLTQVRVEEAKKLIRAGYGKGYEIAPRVGFRDPHYFSSTFKKVCGITPTQYRAQVRGIEAAR